MCPHSAVALYPPGEAAAGLSSRAGTLRLATAVEQLCDPSDIEAVGMMHHPDTGAPTVIVYDVAPGGVGISEAASGVLGRVLTRAAQILVEYPYCSQHPESRGCPYCVTAQYGAWCMTFKPENKLFRSRKTIAAGSVFQASPESNFTQVQSNHVVVSVVVQPGNRAKRKGRAFSPTLF